MGRAFEFRKTRKLKRWSQMSKTFTRLGKDIVIAVKDGGPDPDTNAKLRTVIQNCKSANMPKDNIERAIKRASDKDTEDFKEVLFEGYGPHGIAFIIETTTDNNNRTVANIRSYFTKCNGHLGTSGSVEFLFERKCHFKISKENVDVEELELELIDFGAEEVFVEDNDVIIYADFTNFGDVQKALESKNLEIISSGLERIPVQTKTVDANQEEDLDKLLQKFEEDDDVQNVFHNMA